MTLTESAPSGDAGTARKMDVGKPPMFQGLFNRFPRALKQIAKVSLFGFQKYGSYDGWEKVPDAQARYANALLRHFAAWSSGEMTDTDSKLPHLAQMAWNALAILELDVRKHDAAE